jgi:predicted small secreted protein
VSVILVLVVIVVVVAECNTSVGGNSSSEW